MRRVAFMFLLAAVACGHRGNTADNAQAGVTDGGEIPTQQDAGIDGRSSGDAGGIGSNDGGSGDAGPPEGAGVPDAGASSDAGPADAGPPPPAIRAIDCSEPPTLLWSRTLTGDLGYQIATDEDSNLYWVESDSTPHVFLVSANPDGRDRYRILLPGAEMAGVVVASGKVLVAQGAILEAYETTTGALSWTLDVAAAYPGSSRVGALVDLGNGNLAASHVNGIFFVDIRSGTIVYSQTSVSDGMWPLTSNGAGSVLGEARAGVSTAAEYFVLDSSGAEQWRQRFDGPTGIGPWLTDVPWLGVASMSGISPGPDYVAVPPPWPLPSWYGWVSGPNLIFNLVSGVGLDPIIVQVMRNQAIVAAGPIPKEISFDGLSTWPFVGGDDGNHLVLVGQSSHAVAGLCHPSGPSEPWVARVDEQSLTQCQLTGVSGTLWINAAALIPGRLIVGGIDMINLGCFGPINPFMIAAYALPGESLAPVGWVQNEGNAGLGRRKQRP